MHQQLRKNQEIEEKVIEVNREKVPASKQKSQMGTKTVIGTRCTCLELEIEAPRSAVPHF